LSNEYVRDIEGIDSEHFPHVIKAVLNFSRLAARDLRRNFLIG
jgi:hypothetical protein